MKIYDLDKQATPGPLVVFDRPGIGLTIGWREGDKEGPTCTMRWTDGLNQRVEDCKKADAALLAHCRNNFIRALEALKSRNDDCDCGECHWCKLIAELEEVK